MKSKIINHKSFSIQFTALRALVFVIAVSLNGYSKQVSAESCSGPILHADVVALDQVFFYNRLGAMIPSGMIYALKRDVILSDGVDEFSAGDSLSGIDLETVYDPGGAGTEDDITRGHRFAGHVMLRPDKRPRPLVLRVNEGQCLSIKFTNLLTPSRAGSLIHPIPVDPNQNPVHNDDGPGTRSASIHIIGMQPMGIGSDGSNVGFTGSSIAAPGGTKQYSFHAQKEGTFLMLSAAAMTGGEGNGGSLAHGLFGAVNVEPPGSKYYRSQVTEEELAFAITELNAAGFPVFQNYDDVEFPEYVTRKPNATITINQQNDVWYAVASNSQVPVFRAGDVTDGVKESTIQFDGKKAKISGIENIEGTIAKIEMIAGANPFVDDDTSAPYKWSIVTNEPHPYAGLPVLKLVKNNEIVYSDINAIIAPGGACNDVSTPVNPNRCHPFREFSVIFHDEIKAVQAFPEWYEPEFDPVLSHTLHSVRDGFAINYGTGGIGSEIIANRLGLGPVKDCVECKYEEFFLTSWALGDPAMVVDIPAGVNAIDPMPPHGLLNPEAKMFASKAFYPDDPSNVHHSYLQDHVKFRNLHAGPKEHHVFHLHAHQWVHTPDSSNSAYLDSQAIGPGSSYTYEIAFNGSGNRNKTAGDSIFHCHFYPHFAQGMWELWRVHDVLELGTQLSENGRPAPGSRALPDAEILAGTPIPAVVPIPGKAMAPVPVPVQIAYQDSNPTGQIELPAAVAGNPGYPFFIPGIAGHRPPKPPLDTLEDGGLPRHVVTGGTAHSEETRLSFDKVLDTLSARELPESGTPWEQAAMNFHATSSHSTYTPGGTPENFLTNGLVPQPGAPYADPCDPALTTGNRRYKAVVAQLDVTMNKDEWHFPQQRILMLKDDLGPTLDGIRPPEPLFFRANSGDCIVYEHTNLIPNIYEQDEFQVKTPTDVIGQHIHLVKFDVTSSDGSGNGWNYEDGTFSPEEVHERVVAIQAPQGEWIGDSPTPDCELGNFARNEGGCIQTTVQRWWADPIVNDSGDDRTLRTVFTHDHFGPSTHQHPGLYAGLVIEPFNSTWVHNETGDPLGGRGDGGPTTWEAVILTDNPEESYREFLLEMGDFSLAYRNDEMRSPVNPPAKVEVGLPNLLEVAPQCPGGVDRPCPEAISADDPATMTVNYRNEPIALRVHNPRAGQQTSGEGGDLSFAFESRTDRAIGNLNAASGGPYPPLTEDLLNGDPFTPMLKAYEGDKVQVRILMGAQEEGHNFGMNGAKWLLEPSWENSGYKNSQILGISEHFEFELNALTAVKGSFKYFDSLYAGHAIDDLWNGLWGIMRVYNGGYFKKKPAEAPRLFKLPQNPDGKSPPPIKIGRGKTSTFSMNGVCPSNAPVRNFTIHAVLAQNVLPGGTIIYNEDEGIHDPGAILFVRDEDLDGNTLREGVPVEPLILRANAGDCIHVKLVNDLPGDLAGSQHHGFSTLPMIVEEFNNNHILPSGHVSLQPQLLEFDRLADVGLNIGQNVNNWGVATVPPGGTRTYKWYAGRAIKTVDGDGKTVMTAKPAEYGVVNLMSSDWIKHASKGAVGALVIEPPCSVWDEDGDSDDMRASADIYHDDGCEYSDSPESNYATIEGGDGVFGANDNKLFRELVVVMQDDLNLLDSSGAPIPNLAEAEDPEDSGQKAINYRTEPLWTRTGFPADHPLEMTRDYSEFENILSSSEFGDPATPVFTADAGEAVRFRVVKPGGHARNSTFALHGHGWQQLPWINGSTLLGTNSLSEWKGSESGIGPGSHLNFLLSNGAGGYGGSAGDYLFRDQASFNFDGGLWGIFRVQ